MNLGSAPFQYSKQDEDQKRSTLQTEDGRNLKRGQDIVFSGDASVAHPAVILKRPDGVLRRLVIDNSNNLSTVAV